MADCGPSLFAPIMPQNQRFEPTSFGGLRPPPLAAQAKGEPVFLVLDALRMIQDIRRASRAIDIWGAALNVPQLIGGVAFITAREGQLILVTLVFTLIVAGQIHTRARFSRLIGLCHLPWFALLPWLVIRLQTVDHSIQLTVWGYYVAATIAVSLIFDAIDVYRYTKGQKTFGWAS